MPGVSHTRHIPIGAPAPFLQGGGLGVLGAGVALPLALAWGLALALGLPCCPWWGGASSSLLSKWRGLFLGSWGGVFWVLVGGVLPPLLLLLLCWSPPPGHATTALLPPSHLPKPSSTERAT